MRYEARLRADGRTVAEDMAQLRVRVTLGLLRAHGLRSDRFVTLVRGEMAAGRFGALLVAAGAKHGAGVSLTRSIRNLVRAVRPAGQEDEFCAAFFQPLDP